MQVEYIKATTTQVDMRINGKEFTVNAYAVLCSRTKDDQGRTWYHFASDHDTPAEIKGYMAQQDFCTDVLKQAGITQRYSR